MRELKGNFHGIPRLPLGMTGTSITFNQYWARSCFSLLPLYLDKTLLDSCKLSWLLVTACLVVPPVPCSLCLLRDSTYAQGCKGYCYCRRDRRFDRYFHMTNRSLMRTMADFAVTDFRPSVGVLSIPRRN